MQKTWYSITCGILLIQPNLSTFALLMLTKSLLFLKILLLHFKKIREHFHTQQYPTEIQAFFSLENGGEKKKREDRCKWTKGVKLSWGFLGTSQRTKSVQKGIKQTLQCGRYLKRFVASDSHWWTLMGLFAVFSATVKSQINFQFKKELVSTANQHKFCFNIHSIYSIRAAPAVIYLFILFCIFLTLLQFVFTHVLTSSKQL